MSQVCITLPLIVLFSVRLVYGFPGDTVMLMPPFEVRNVDPYLTHPSQPFTSQFQANRNNPQQVPNTNVIHRRQPQVPVAEKQSNQNLMLGEFMEALNEVSQQSQHREEELQRLRTTGSAGRDENPAYSTLPRPMGYSRPNYAPPATYHETASIAPLTPPSSAQPKIPVLKPDFSGVLAPVATKVSTKTSGLLGLIFSLLTSSSSGLQLNGIKDVLIEGIIKPLLVAKGGIKALISKLSIPVISLLLINLEVLITVWWLWEDCPAPLPEPAPTPSYSKPASYNSNYNSYS